MFSPSNIDREILSNFQQITVPTFPIGLELRDLTKQYTGSLRKVHCIQKKLEDD